MKNPFTAQWFPVPRTSAEVEADLRATAQIAATDTSFVADAVAPGVVRIDGQGLVERGSVPLTFAQQYKRRLLDVCGASPMVDLSTMTITNDFIEAYSYSEYNSEPTEMRISVSWRDTVRDPYSHDRRSGPDGCFTRFHSLSNDEVARFLDSLEKEG